MAVRMEVLRGGDGMLRDDEMVMGKEDEEWRGWSEEGWDE